MEKKKYLTFTTNSEATEVLLEWWRALDVAHGDRAELRRCHSPLNVAFTPAFHRLRMDLWKLGTVKDGDLALIAGVLSHIPIKSYVPGSFPIQMANPGSSNAKKAKVSSLRFRRLLVIDDRNKLYEMMIRIVHLLGDTMDIPSLANGIYWWNERTKKEWAYAYYENAPRDEMLKEKRNKE